MEILEALKAQEAGIKELLETTIKARDMYRQRALATEVIVWELKGRLEENQRTRILRLKEKSKIEQLAFKAGMTIEQAKQALLLIKDSQGKEGNDNQT